MLKKTHSSARRGTTSVEFAVTCPIVFFLLLATITGGVGVFRYQQMASLAREGARWASVHGGQYALETGQPAATPQDVFEKGILPMAAALDVRRLSYSVKWDKSNMPFSLINDDVQTPRANKVTVTVTYQWFPEVFLVGPITLTSSSTAQMMY
jgi:Flp pilus assembly protein TadG